MSMIRADTRIHSLYGSPVSHSLSPVIFNTVFEKLSINRMYIPFEVTSDNLKPAVDAARTLAFEGFNVTMPHKIRIIEMLDRLDRSAEESGSVNTVARAGNQLVGYNTDGEGAVRALRSYGFEPTSKRIVVLGAGGAARALVHRFSKEQNTITILNRTLEKARVLATTATGPASTSYGQLSQDALRDHLGGTDLLVNATPIQTPALLSQLKVPADLAKDVRWVFDLAYDKPSELTILGRSAISPLEMLVQQAALSYEIWMNKPAPLALMRASLVDHLGKNWK